MSTPKSILPTALAGMAILALAMGIGRFAFTPLLPLMLSEGLVSVSDGGVLASVHFLGYLLGAVFAGRFTRFPKRTLQISLVTIGVSTLGMGLTENFTAWLIFRWLCGFCSAFALLLVSNYYIKHLEEAGQAQLQGWVFAGVGAGIALVGLGTLGFMANQIDSALSWQIFGVIALAGSVAVFTQMGHEIPARLPALERHETSRTPLVWSIVVAYGVMGLGYIIPATYLPVMAQEVVKSPLIFGWGWPVFGAAAFLSTLLAARLHAHFSNRHIWAVSQIVMATGLLLPVIYQHIATIILGGVCVGGTFVIITMAGIKEAHRIASAGDVHRHIAAITAAFATGQMVGPALAGWIYDTTQSFSASLIMTSAALAATAIPLVGRPSRAGLLHR